MLFVVFCGVNGHFLVLGNGSEEQNGIQMTVVGAHCISGCSMQSRHFQFLFVSCQVKVTSSHFRAKKNRSLSCKSNYIPNKSTVFNVSTN